MGDFITQAEVKQVLDFMNPANTEFVVFEDGKFVMVSKASMDNPLSKELLGDLTSQQRAIDKISAVALTLGANTEPQMEMSVTQNSAIDYDEKQSLLRLQQNYTVYSEVKHETARKYADEITKNLSNELNLYIFTNDVNRYVEAAEATRQQNQQKTPPQTSQDKTAYYDAHPSGLPYSVTKPINKRAIA